MDVIPFDKMEKFFKVSHPAVNGVLKRLEEKGFISTELITNGKTQKIVHLEKKGNEAVEIMDKIRNIDDENLSKEITSQEWEELYRILSKILNTIS